MANFECLCSEIVEKNFLKALSSLRVLFLIDGFDETNKTSMAVFRELLQKTWHTDSRILITTRTQATGELKKLIAQKDCKHSDYNIAPLSELQAQLKFIENYEKKLTYDIATSGSMPEQFSKINPTLQQSFTEPISLLQFCSICMKVPEKITRWRNFNDVSRDTLQLQKNIAKERLDGIFVANKEILIDEVFMVISSMALEFLACNMTTFTDDELLPFKRHCYEILKKHGANKEIDAGIFISAMFRINRSLSGSLVTTYSLPQKSLLDMAVAIYISQRAMNTNKSLLEMLGKHLKTKSSLLDVLIIVMQDLNSNPRQFLKRWPELMKAFMNAGVTSGSDWQELMLRSPDVAELAKHAAKITIAETDKWHVYSTHDLTAISLMLQYEKPRLIDIKLPSAVLRAASSTWLEVTRIHQGGLKLDISAGLQKIPKPCDDLLDCFNGSRCQLFSLVSCISSAAAVTAVASVSTPATTKLNLSMPTPINLDGLRGKYKRLQVEIWPLDAAWAALSQPAQPPPCQEEHGAGDMPGEALGHGVRLPAQPPPGLTLYDVSPGSLEAVVRVVHAIAPPTKRFGSILLPVCELNKDEVQQLLVRLKQDGVRSAVHGRTCSITCYDNVMLSIADDLPELSGNERAVQQILAQEQASCDNFLKAQRPEVLRMIQEEYSRMATRLLQPELKTAFFAAFKGWSEDNVFRIETSHDLEMVAMMLPLSPDSSVMVKTSPLTLDSLKWLKIVQCHSGNLILDLLNLGSVYKTSDGVLQSLLNGRSKIRSFTGFLKTAAGVAALASTAEEAILCPCLDALLDVTPLLGKYTMLNVTTPVISTAVKARLPLPSYPPPLFTVFKPLPGSCEAVVQTVTIFSPKNKRSVL
ncbi:uncharacterized protein LOC125178579 [Hyalella azteca]|uniref:Uncharacterized protein LOC125178579 n=1 Tax=Hyalella azteca TaxID=294128 RepID=A0A979FQ98_HYAAZ|nr:uncharacterized protein LOC125178579 [Hyalella azteca]